MVNKKSKSEEVLDRTAAFRMSQSTFDIFEERLLQAGMSKSEFFREVFINSNVNFNIKAAPSKDYSRMLFLFNKASNNLNQLAYLANSSRKRGLVNDALGNKILRELVQIRQLLISGIQHVN